MQENHKNHVLASGNNGDVSEMINEHLASMESLSVKIREALNNGLQADHHLEGHEEKAILLDLSNEIAAASSKDDLFNGIYIKLKSLFGIEKFAIVLLNDDQTCRAFEFDENNYTANGKGLNDPELQKCFLPEALLEEIDKSNNPVFLDLIISDIEVSAPGYIKKWIEQGIEKVAAIGLKVGGALIGFLHLYMEPERLMNLHTNLLKSVSSQLSVALSNIMLIEELTQRKNEMELLLSINTSMASVRNSEELASVIKHQFKQLLGCSHSGIAICNTDGKSVSPFLLDDEAKAKHHPAFQDAIKGRYPVTDPVFNKTRKSDLPVLFDLDEMASQGDLPLYIKVNYDNGRKFLLVSRFDKEDKVFGYWFLYFNEKQNFSLAKLKLVQSLAYQLCISVANIIANQEIKLREKEKERLLGFSNAVATVRDKEALSQILKVQLQELFSINNYSIYILDKERKNYKPVFNDTESEINGSELGVKITDDDEFFNEILATNGPVYYPTGADFVSGLAESFFQLQDNISNRNLIGISVQIGLEDIAIIIFTHHDFSEIKLHEPLLKGICSQIAITVAHILANERVNQQLLEIDGFKRQLEEETIYLKEEIEVNQNYAEIIGDSPVMQKTFRLVTQVAPSDSTVLILGETGTGKELIARAIHNNSPRKNKLMVKVNCAALPANLIESELFGHEKGSFTGATERRLGKFELANNGTLFLDEIGEMPLELQVKLLRALQEKEIERVGGRGTIKVDVRIIAATNRDLEKEVDEGRFRSDLFYRLNIFPIQLSALRDRKEDIPVLATHFIHRYSKKTGRQITTLSSKALQDMMTYNWPGNIRELEHLIERSILLTAGETLKHVYLPSLKIGTSVITANGEIQLKTIDENECEHILRILKFTQGRISGRGGAADILGIPPSTLNSKIKRLGIKKEHLV
ncbi:sigma 54-interacting transcriptional regulator [Mucilaginibacter aquariorum]|uniref:Sigma 54-interacting transcriptional regulator n=1 Tax=Mucilaginibacter aquariorum TaxID=2967225 RepID=A0ABT1SXF3_9SPHI|nr:sigma 54-interacting transcriptional regulator [Mucilaginibacter aquariorum]MCQ6957014.1 sigma 54-interacting transcriptional regulator [Mucilaginibacter aquariorum]